MSKYRTNLPQLGSTFLTDGGLETTLIFEKGIELPEFAAFTLLKDRQNTKDLSDYYIPYIELAKKKSLGFILESPTWRASLDWGKKLGYNQNELELLNIKAIDLLVGLRDQYEDETSPMPISGCIGPRGDGYRAENKMTSNQARQYHATQIQTIANTKADLVSAFTITYVEEAVGITNAALMSDIPVVISFTVETDGRLPSGQPLKSAIQEVDHRTSNGPAYYMINCAHPTHFADAFENQAGWVERILAIRANASCKSHEELDEAEELDRGNPEDFAHQYKKLGELLPQLKVVGGCCGTDSQHIEAICNSMHAFS